ncbi:dynamin family protein [Virgisporangium ochraceum]|uniref:Dynamin n=1 Tax=Virgisporangium ochraceum TaxID=65505 RepID=A0A8J3ZU14_9ACTN|nr:dynamin family protein [Virgisporangium ochraceum]GIJ67490.1 dynamin [Virgisporangium ochraceum]
MSDPGDVGRTVRSALLARAVVDLDRARDLALEAGRTDLAERLDDRRAGLVGRTIPVAVVGEFKQGKSSLVNALLRTDVCPVDADIVTAVPTIVRYGRRPSVVAHLAGPDGAEPTRAKVPFERLREYVTRTDPDEKLRAVEVQLNRRILASGLSFIDTPGVGGLDSAHGNLTLGTLPLADAALFVTDARQELTAPEVDFLTRTIERCPSTVVVVTKVDLQVEWRRIVDLNRGHLAKAGLDLPIVAVSSFLRLLAARRSSTGLNEESGFPRLLEVLHGQILTGSDTAAARTAAQETGFVLAQLREQVAAEQAVVVSPDSAPELTERYAEKARRVQSLSAGGWQTMLVDGIQDLSTDVEHDLRERLRAMVRRGTAMIEAGDPRDTWHEFQGWAAREATAAAVDNLFALVTRTEQLARDVAERFDLEYDGLDVDLPAPAVTLAEVTGPQTRFEKRSTTQFLSAFTAARVAIVVPVMFGAFGSLLGLTVAAPIGLVVGLTVGRKLLRHERDRQIESRRQVARQELQRYVDEVAFLVGKDSRDAVRRTQRFLRDEFAARAALAERSSSAALAAVRSGSSLPDRDRARRAAELDARGREIDTLVKRVSA